MRNTHKEVSKDSLNLIREKVLRKDCQLNEKETLAFKEVYHDITGHHVSKGCQACIAQAMTSVYNYVTYHEQVDMELVVVKEQPKTELKYPELLSLAKKHGYKGGRISVEKLNNFINEKQK